MAFYNGSKTDLNERGQARNLSETNGFFNIRQNRTGNFMGGVSSKGFGNYVKARERAETIAKSHIEK